MRPHISLDIRDVHASVDFYQKVFDLKPQKQTTDYATGLPAADKASPFSW